MGPIIGNDRYQWVDVTSYEPGERGQVAPRTWSLKRPGMNAMTRGLFTIIISRRALGSAAWVLYCRELGIDGHVVLDHTELALAQKEALDHVIAHIRKVAELAERMHAELYAPDAPPAEPLAKGWG